MRTAIKYVLYPFLLLISIGSLLLAYFLDWDLETTFIGMAVFRFITLFVIEWLHPLKLKWKMTKGSFIRDLKWMVVNGVVFALPALIVQVFAIDFSDSTTGLLSNVSIFTGTVVYLLVFEFFQYWFHRISHEGKGKFRKWLWKIHLAHHLPQEVYLLMHGVGHPLNAIVVIIITQIPLLTLGAPPETVFFINAIKGLQGLISHYNVEIKAGWFNYIFIGAELHRFHHSANVNEAKNYGSIISIWDLVFGTFYYDPKNVPIQLGVENPELYPDSNELLKVLAVPFKKEKPKLSQTDPHPIQPGTSF